MGPRLSRNRGVPGPVVLGDLIPGAKLPRGGRSGVKLLSFPFIYGPGKSMGLKLDGDGLGTGIRNRDWDQGLGTGIRYRDWDQGLGTRTGC